MTRIVGNVKDVGMNGVEGLLYAYSGFRPSGEGVIAPRRSYWVVSGGELPDDVNVYPGPAVLLIEAGMDARREFRVTIPDQDTVTLGELVVGGFDWDEEVISIVDSYLVEMRELADQVASDRGRSETAREGAETAQNRSETARDAAEGYRGQAGASASAAADSEANAATSEVNSKASEVAADADRQAAEEARDQAQGHASEAQGHSNDASAASVAARGYRDEAQTSSESTGEDRVHVDEVRANLEALLADSEAWAGFEEALAELEPRMAAEIDKLKGDAPEAFDTLGEVAAWIADHSDEAAAMLQSISERAKTSDVEAALEGKADAGAEDTATWSGVSGKPSTFPPSSHVHAWGEITGKPASFPPSTHSHGMSDVTGLSGALADKANASQLGGKSIVVVSELPGSPDPNTLYFIEES